MFPPLGHCKSCCCGCSRKSFVRTPISILLGTYLRMELLGCVVILLNLLRNHQIFLCLELATPVTGSGPLHVLSLLTQTLTQLGPCLPFSHSLEITSLERIPDHPGYEGPRRVPLSLTLPYFPSRFYLHLLSYDTAPRLRSNPPQALPSSPVLFLDRSAHGPPSAHIHCLDPIPRDISEHQRPRKLNWLEPREASQNQRDPGQCGQTQLAPEQLLGGMVRG